MKRLLILFLVTFIPLLTRAIPPNELPLGSYMLGDDSDTSIAKLRNELGFNVFQTGLPSNEVLERFLAHSIQPIVNSMSPQDSGRSPERWSYAHYVFMEVGSSNPDKDYKFQSRGSGGSIHESEWVSNGADTLIGFDTQHYPRDLDTSLKACFLIDRNYEGNYIGDEEILWNLEISIKIDSIATPPDTIVARIEGWFAPCYADLMPDSQNGDWTVLNLGSVRADSLLPAGQFHTRKFSFIIPDTIRFRHRNTATWICLGDSSYHENGGSIGFNLRIYTTGARTVTVDWVKLYEEQGLRLANNDTTAINPIKRFLQQHNQTSAENNIFGWYLRDEPVASNLDPFGKIDSLIRYVNPNWRHFTMNNLHPMMRSYLYRSHADLIDMDYYPLGPLDLYTGFIPEVPDQEQHRFQNRMNYMNYWMREYRNRADDMGKQLWMTPQAFWDINDRDWRKPTPSELWCMTNIALCYHTEGFVYWKYDPNGNGQYPGFRQLVNGHLITTDLYDKMKNDINPYIKAIDSTYMNLVWERAYICTTGMENPGPLVHSIRAVSNTDDPNPDLGWFHIGEFSDEAGVPYVMIVNRACSQGPDTSAEAPEITAFINFNIYSSDDSAYIITDIAKGTNAGNWTGYSEITYSAPLNGSVPFTTTFKAGEGRLFRLKPTTIHNLPSLVTGDTIYQGGIRSSSIMVPDSNTMRIIAPAQVKVASGRGITIQGNLNVKGYESDTVKFIPANDTSWHGIHFRFHNSTGNFDYCKIEKVNNYGIFLDSAGLDDTIGIKLNHCVIQNTFYDPVYCYKSQATILNSIIDGNDNSYYGISNIKGKVKAVSSTIKGCEIYGLYADSAVSKLDSCLFENCWRYGIYSYGHPAGTNDSTLVTNCSIQRTASPNPDSSQYGIYVSSNAKIRLANNLIRNCGQGGIRLSSGNARVYNNTIRNMSSAGILCENSAVATIRNCVLDTIPTGIYSTANTSCYIRSNKLKHHSYGVRSWGIPNLGDAREAGHNNIEDCSIMFISKPQITFPPQTVYAINNYYGPGTPDSAKFSPGVIYIPYYLSDPWLKRHIIEDAPFTYSIDSNYPNPFNPQTTISFNLIEPAQTRVLIYNVLGQKIKTLVNEYLSSGQYSYIWDGRTDLGIEAASGVYLYRIESGSFAQTKKMTLMR